MREMWRRLAVLVAVVTVAACGGSPTLSSSRPGADPAILSVAPVLSSSPPPCDDSNPAVLPELTAGVVTACLTIGDAAVTAADVDSASILPNEGTDRFLVNVTLTAAGSDRFDAFLAGHLDDRTAFISFGRLIGTAPVSVSSADGEFSVGTFELAEAQRLVGELHGDPSAPATNPPGPRDERAWAVCDAHRPPDARTAVINAASFTAAQMTQVIAQLPAEPHATAAPWDSLPADHYVAFCDYAPPDQDHTTTTLCPDGTSPVLAVIEPQSYFVDEDGHFTAAFTNTACS